MNELHHNIFHVLSHKFLWPCKTGTCVFVVGSSERYSVNMHHSDVWWGGAQVTVCLVLCLCHGWSVFTSYFLAVSVHEGFSIALHLQSIMNFPLISLSITIFPSIFFNVWAMTTKLFLKQRKFSFVSCLSRNSVPELIFWDATLHGCYIAMRYYTAMRYYVPWVTTLPWGCCEIELT